MERDRTGGLPVLIGPSDIEVAAAAGLVIVWGEADEARHRCHGRCLCPLPRSRRHGGRGGRRVARRPFKAHSTTTGRPARTTTLVACCGMAPSTHRSAKGAIALSGSPPSSVQAWRISSPDRLVQVLLSTEGRPRTDLRRLAAVVLNRVRAEHADLVAEICERIGAVDGSIPVIALDELTPQSCLTSLGDQAITMVIVPIMRSRGDHLKAMTASPKNSRPAATLVAGNSDAVTDVAAALVKPASGKAVLRPPSPAAVDCGANRRWQEQPLSEHRPQDDRDEGHTALAGDRPDAGIVGHIHKERRADAIAEA